MFSVDNCLFSEQRHTTYLASLHPLQQYLFSFNACSIHSFVLRKSPYRVSILHIRVLHLTTQEPSETELWSAYTVDSLRLPHVS